MFLPSNKYTIKQASWGDFTLSGSSDEDGYYVGPYIEDYLGRTFAGSSLKGAENRVLIPSENLLLKKDIRKDRVIKIALDPTDPRYLTGSYTRYFRQNQIDKTVYEVDKEAVTSDTGSVWKTVSGSWILTGSLDDRLIYRHTYRGVRWRNQKTLDRWEKEIPGMVEALNLKPEDFVIENFS